MTLFLIVFFLLYGTLHLYVFLKARVAFDFGITTGFMVAVLMIVMVAAPVIVRLSEKAGFELFSRFLSYGGYMWLGLIFLFVSASICIDVYRLSVHVGSIFLNKDLSLISLSPRSSFVIPVIVSILIAIYGYFEAQDIRAEKIELRTHKIPEAIGRIRIVQISDVHLGLIVREKRLKKILKEIKRADPDILVSTGDLVDGQINELEGLAELLQGIKPRHGKFAITGNHEFYAGLPQALRFTKKAGFMILRGEGRTVKGLINIAGVDDPTGNYFAQSRGVSEKELLSGLPSDKFTVLLKHRPLVDSEALGLFDLQLSGHTHKGQIFPFNIVTWLYYPNHAGCLNQADNCFLYVSRGTGTWGPPIRFLSPPEVTVIDIVYKNK